MLGDQGTHGWGEVAASIWTWGGSLVSHLSNGSNLFLKKTNTNISNVHVSIKKKTHTFTYGRNHEGFGSSCDENWPPGGGVSFICF